MESGARKFECFECGRKWDEPYGTGRPLSCPACGSKDIHRAPEDRARRGARTGCLQARMGGRGGRKNG